MEPLIEAVPFEMWTIGGAAIATMLMANSMHDVKHTLGAFGKMIKGAAFHKADYIELLSLLYFLVRLASTKGAMALEAHIEKPAESAGVPEISQDPRQSPRQHDHLRLPAHGRHERRRPQPDRGRHGAGTEEDPGRGTASLAHHADHGGRAAGAGDRRRGAGRDQDDVAHRSAAGRAGRDDRRRADRHVPGHSAGLWHGRPVLRPG